ncbi:hypothetical protein B0H21DRAFT_140838 [Amylocystis lapponica]|nr:hypothetical protein B0H21DRAFT_140838 [Amylocystis lapponica]
MGYDLTCFLSGYPHASSLNEVMDEYLDDILAFNDPWRQWTVERRRDFHLSAACKVFEPYTAEDEENRRDMVLIGPFDDAHNLTPLDITTIEVSIDVVLQGLIRAIHVVPSDDIGRVANSGTFVSTITAKSYDLYSNSSSLIFVNASALRILSLAAPALTPPRLWALQKQVQNSSLGVDYGRVTQGGMYVQLHCFEDDMQFDQWVVDVLRREAPTEEDRRELMMGTGRMFAFVRPNVFPVVEAFAYWRVSLLANARSRSEATPFRSEIPTTNHLTFDTLPIDVILDVCSHLSLSALFKLCLASRFLHATLSPFISTGTFIRNWMAQHEPWYLPPPDGQERLWFNEQCQLALQDEKEIRDGDVLRCPWLWYARACGESPSMRNRARIWSVAKQLEELANATGYLAI